MMSLSRVDRGGKVCLYRECRIADEPVSGIEEHLSRDGSQEVEDKAEMLSEICSMRASSLTVPLRVTLLPPTLPGQCTGKVAQSSGLILVPGLAGRWKYPFRLETLMGSDGTRGV